jgi:tRNA(Ile)-lysidine synthase
MGFSAAALVQVLESLTPPTATGLVAAISGGDDSACLLTALLQRGPRPLRGLPVRAVHVDHDLQPSAADFRHACETLCDGLGVPLTVLAVRVERGRGVSIEAAARDARYAALAENLKDGECLLTAHHADDQAETLLLQLMRGAGLAGLAAMPRCRVWAGGWHLRPLLSFVRHDLRRFASGAGVTAVADPMNEDLRFERAYLRRHVWPVLEARWPGAALTLSRTAGHMAEAQGLLDRNAARAVELLRDGDALSVAGLRALSPPERVNTLRHWIADHAVPPPPSARLNEALRQILAADADHQPAVLWGEHALRRYRNRLFLTPAHPPALPGPREWPFGAQVCLALGDRLGTLQWSPQPGGLDRARLPDTLVVRSRRGGEALRVHRRARLQSLQHLCQSFGVLPWMRDALPLVYAGDDLIAVGDLWQDARWCVAPGAAGFACTWSGAPILV